MFLFSDECVYFPLALRLWRADTDPSPFSNSFMNYMIYPAYVQFSSADPYLRSLVLNMPPHHNTVWHCSSAPATLLPIFPL